MSRTLISYLVGSSPGFRKILSYTVDVWLSPEGEVLEEILFRELAGHVGDLIRDGHQDEAWQVFAATEALARTRYGEMIQRCFLDEVFTRVPQFIPRATLLPLLGPSALEYAMSRSILSPSTPN